MRAAAWPTKRPANSAVAHDARHILSDMPLHHRTPRNQREVARPLDQGLPPTRHIDRTGQATLYRSEEHTSELQSLMRISYAVFCLKKKNNIKQKQNKINTSKM